MTHRKLQTALVDGRTAELEAQQAQHVADRGTAVGDDEHEVADRRARCVVTMPASSASLRNLATGELSAQLLVDLHPHQALGTPLLGLLGQLVEPSPAAGRAVGHDGCP